MAGPYTVNRAQPRVSNVKAPFASVHGPGYRAIYDLADLDAIAVRNRDRTVGQHAVRVLL